MDDRPPPRGSARHETRAGNGRHLRAILRCSRLLGSLMESRGNLLNTKQSGENIRAHDRRLRADRFGSACTDRCASKLTIRSPSTARSSRARLAEPTPNRRSGTPKLPKPKPGTPNVLHHSAGRRGLFAVGQLRRIDQDAQPRRARRRRLALQQLPHHGAMFALAGRADGGAKSASHRVGLARAHCDGLPRLQRPSRPKARNRSPRISSTPALRPLRWANGTTRRCRKLRRAGRFSIGPAAKASTISMASWQPTPTTIAP